MHIIAGCKLRFLICFFVWCSVCSSATHSKKQLKTPNNKRASRSHFKQSAFRRCRRSCRRRRRKHAQRVENKDAHIYAHVRRKPPPSPHPQVAAAASATVCALQLFSGLALHLHVTANCAVCIFICLRARWCVVFASFRTVFWHTNGEPQCPFVRNVNTNGKRLCAESY